MKIRRGANKDAAEAIIDYFGAVCSYCTSQKVYIHHIIPVARGGKNVLSNLELVCKKCHSSLHKQWNIIMPLKKFATKKCIRCEKVEFIKIKFKKDTLCENCYKWIKIIKKRNENNNKLVRGENIL